MLILAFACKSAPPAKEQQSFEQWVAENLGEKILCRKNSNNAFALCVQESDNSQAMSYFIVRISDRSIVAKDNISRASLTWIDDYKVEIKFTPGIIQKDTDRPSTKVIDVSKFIIEKL